MDTINKKSLLRGKTFSRLLVVLFAAFMISLLAFATTTSDDAVAAGELGDYEITWVVDDAETTTSVSPGVLPSMTNPTKTATAEFTYEFTGWTPDITIATSDKTYTAQFSETVNEYAITWMIDGTETTEQVAYGTVPAYVGTPTKTATAQYTFTFDKWDVTPISVVADATYTAQFSEILNKYTIIWNVKDATEAVIATDTADLEFGDISTYDTDDFNLDNAQYTYAFGAWSPAFAPVTGDMTYTTVATKAVNYYTIVFMNGTTQIEKKTLQYNDTFELEYSGTPTKAGDDYYVTYTFNGWKAENGTTYVNPFTVQEDITFNAIFTEEDPVEYTIEFKNHDTVVKTETLHFDAVIHAPVSDPTKEATVESVFTFNGWSDYTEGMTVSENKVFTAQFTSSARQYTITWDIDGNIKTTKVNQGLMPSFASEFVTDKFTYTITGWTPDVVVSNGNATYVAEFNDPVVNKYTITWIVGDFTYDTELEYGAMPVHNGVLVTDEYTYTISTWDTPIVSVTENKTYTAVDPTSTITEYTITWIIDESEFTTEVAYGSTPISPVDIDYEYVTDKNTYTITDWDTSIADVTGDKTYTANYSKVINKYTITWNIDGNIETTSVEYGGTPSYDVSDPYTTDKFVYTITGWTPEIGKVTGEQIYSATFTKESREYDVTWKLPTKNITKKVAYGSVIPTPPTPADYTDAGKDYTFTHWETDDEVVYKAGVTTITGNVTFEAIFDDVTEYTITWKVGSEETEVKLTNGEVIVAPADPTKESTDEFDYTFSGWNDFTEGDKVTENVTFTAEFDGTVRTYTITWDVDGVEITTTVAYGETPALVGTPERTSTPEFTFKFDDWDPSVTTVTEDATYTATFSKETREYEVIFKDGDTSHLPLTLKYGTVINEPLPKGKEGDSEYDGYTFKEWKTADGIVYEAGMTVSKNMEFEAVYSGVGDVKEHTVKWIVDGTVIDTQTDEYGTALILPENPTKESTDQYDYAFDGWISLPLDAENRIITESTSYVADWADTTRTYTITWVVDGFTVKTEKLEYGADPSGGSEFTTSYYSYTEVLWPTTESVDSDTTYTATFAAGGPELFDITWTVDGVTRTTEVAYGAMPNHYTPVKAAKGKYTYKFEGWNPEVTEVVGDMDYDAVFSKSLITYDITWEVDGRADKITSVTIDTVPTYGAIPTKASDDDYSYKFVEWGPEVVKATGDTTYTAIFEKTALDTDVVDDDTGDDNTALYVGLAVVVIIVVGVIAVFAVRARN